jgi:hypothetical protein
MEKSKVQEQEMDVVSFINNLPIQKRIDAYKKLGMVLTQEMIDFQKNHISDFFADIAKNVPDNSLGLTPETIKNWLTEKYNDSFLDGVSEIDYISKKAENLLTVHPETALVRTFKVGNKNAHIVIKCSNPKQKLTAEQRKARLLQELAAVERAEQKRIERKDKISEALKKIK